MKFRISLLFFSSTLFPATTVAQNTDSQVSASWTQQGVCAYYYEKPGKSSSLSDTCIKYCENNGGHGYSECDRTPYANMNLPDGIDKSLINQDEEGDSFVPCKCKCENKDVEGIANAFADIVIEALSHLDEIICGVFMTSMVTIVEVGIDLIPGGAELTAARRAVEGVKTFTENALDVADSMGNWVGKACGIEDPNWPNSLFDILLTSPDSYGTSVGCKKSKNSDCKKVDPVPDKPKTKSPDDPGTKQPDPATSSPKADPTSGAHTTETPITDTPTTDIAITKVSTTDAPTTNTPLPVSTSDTPDLSTSADSSSVSTSDTPNISTSVDPSSVSTSGTSDISTSADPSASTPDTPNVSTSLDPSSVSVTNTPDPTATTLISSATSGFATQSSSSSTTSCASGTGSKTAGSCDPEPTTPCKITNPDIGGDDPLETADEILNSVRDLDLAGIIGLRDGHRSPRTVNRLQKRAVKSGNPCDISTGDYKKFKLASDNYPSNGKLDDNVPSWGYKVQDDFCDYEWQDGTTKIAKNSYDSEHVMEWQVVTDFFRKLQEKGGNTFDHPDPAKQGTKTDFCAYWIESWKLDAGQKFAINGSETRLPMNHIAAAYPSNKNFKDEMIRLQKNINAPAKANLFKDDVPMVWTQGEMNTLVNSDRNKVLERMRLLLGARKYLANSKVIAIFKAQKERMGAMLDQLDTDMETNVRQTVNTTTGVITPWTPWKKQNLLTEWNTYMDTKWANAIAKHKKVMDKFIDDMDDTHCQSRKKKSPDDKKFCERLRNLQTKYSSAPAFVKPW